MSDIKIGSLLYGIVSGFAGNFVTPYAIASDRFMFNEEPNMLPPVTELINALYRGNISLPDFEQSARELGFDKRFATMLYDSAKNIIGTADLVSSWRREIITEGELNAELKKQRFSDSDIENIKMVTEYFPTAPDIVHFAVREVYTPEVVERFKLMSDIPGKYITEAKKAGLSEEQAKNYWASHWILPSPNQGFEMLHRNVIDENDLNMLLKSLDIMPFWRDKLTQISHNPLTRVDVRRMYRLGVLNEAQVKKSYKDIGYDGHNADLMTEFTVKYENQDKTGLTRASIIDAYKKSIIDENQAIDYLVDLGLTESEINLLLSSVEYEMLDKLISDNVDELKARYRIGLIDLDDFKTELNTMDLPSSFVDKVISEEAVKISNKVKMPTKTDAEKWLKLNLIDEKKYTEYLKSIGYRQEDILLYLAEITKEVDTSKRKFLTIATYVRWLKSDIMTLAEFTEVATNMNIGKRDIARHIKEAGKQ